MEKHALVILSESDGEQTRTCSKALVPAGLCTELGGSIGCSLVPAAEADTGDGATRGAAPSAAPKHSEVAAVPYRR